MSKSEKGKAYDRAYRAGQRNSNDEFKRGRRQRTCDTRLDIKRHLTGDRNCKWLKELIADQGYELDRKSVV